jgi:hypothetical protein
MDFAKSPVGAPITISRDLCATRSWGSLDSQNEARG